MPLWEDPENCEGGRVTLTLTGKELLPFLWETLVCSLLNSLNDYVPLLIAFNYHRRAIQCRKGDLRYFSNI